MKHFLFTLKIIAYIFLGVCIVSACSKDDSNIEEPINVQSSSEIQGIWKEKFEGKIIYNFSGNNYDYKLIWSDEWVLKEHGTFKISNGIITFSELKEVVGYTLPGSEHSCNIKWKDSSKEELYIDELLYHK